MEKYDIVNGLAREFGLRRYLEICTSTTGLKFQYVDPANFDACHRLMYRCPPGHDDGFEVTRRTEADTSHALVAELHASLPAAERYDIIFVDPHHTYRASRLDLLGALCLLAPHGIMVVHDCNPTDPSIVQPQFQQGSWCGVTYQAYVDFLLGGHAAGHCTVDADYGCGVVFNTAAAVPAPWRNRRPPERLALDWAAAADDDAQRYAFFDQHRAALLNLVAPEHFRAVHPLCRAARLPTPATAAGSNSFTEDPGIHLIAGDLAIAPFAAEAETWLFRIPPGTQRLRLVSRAISPAVLNGSQDTRPLGLCLLGIDLHIPGGDLLHHIAPDDPGFLEGIHPVERNASRTWRWTSGSALLPPLPPSPAETILTLHARRMPRYPAADS
jgi:hypothetical protein